MIRKLIRQLDRSWRTALSNFPNREAILDDLDTILAINPINYYPTGKQIFAAFHATPFDKVRVVIIGKDPYPQQADATGMAFSTPIGRPMSQSVAMIYCSIASDLGGKIPIHGNLDHWAQQDVLLLNRVLTFCNDGKGNNTHMNVKWKNFTQAVVQVLIDSRRPIHFVRWGCEAQEINIPNDYPKHLIHTAPHPSPRNINSERFRTCYSFSKINKELLKNLDTPINWLPESRYCARCALFNKRKNKHMNMQTSVITCFKKFITIKGRASRSEYWWFYLFINLISFSIAFFASGSLSEYGISLWIIITLAPWVCVSVRRFHDIDKNGRLLLFYPVCITLSTFFSLFIIVLIIEYFSDYRSWDLYNFWKFGSIFISVVATYITLTVLTCKKGTDGENRFGADPLAE